MVGSIDPRCETVRGTHWHKTGRVVVGSSRRGNHLGQRSKQTASTGRTYGCKRSDQTSKTSCATGAVHIWVPAFAGTTHRMRRANYRFGRRTASARLAFADPGFSGFCWLSCGAQPDDQITSKVARMRPSGSAKRSA